MKLNDAAADDGGCLECEYCDEELLRDELLVVPLYMPWLVCEKSGGRNRVLGDDDDEDDDDDDVFADG